LKKPELIKQKIKDFVFNPKMRVVQVTGVSDIDSISSSKVYNLEIEDNNNYFAYGILVHNCRVVSRATEMRYVDKLFPIRRCIYIGDMISDATEAAKAGWDFLSPQDYIHKVENGEL
jgi:hypothetical protein